MITTLVEGSVQFENNKGKKLSITPGNQVTYDSKDTYIEQVDIHVYTSWKEGKMMFKNEPLHSMVSRLERWYNVDIQLEGENIRNLKYTGTIEMETFSEVLELIKTTAPIDYSFDRKTRILTIQELK